MRNLIVSFAILFSNYIFAQIVIFENCDIKISLLKNNISLEDIKNDNDIYFLIFNKSNLNVSFRKDSFEGESFIYKDGEIIETKQNYNNHFNGYLGSLEIGECQKSFVKLKPRQTIKIALRLISLRNVYNYISPDLLDNYEIEINSVNNIKTASYNACNKYIDILKKTKIVEINIHKKIKLVK